MIFDLIVLAFFAVFIISGMRKGFLYQLVRLALLVVAWFAARWVYPSVAPVLRHVSDMPPEFQGLLAFVLTFLGLFLLGTILAATFLARWHDSHPVAGALDRVAGGVLGGAKFAALAYIAMCFGLALGPAFGRTYQDGAEGSLVLRWVSAHNALYQEAGVYLRGTRHLMESLADPEKAAALAEDPEIRAFLKGSDGDALRSVDVKAAVQAGDWGALLSDPRVQQMFANPQFYRALERVAAQEKARAGDDHYSNRPGR
jgi:uncharacterized membrane protein required for colicin V production